MSSEECLLGIDIGTSHVKALLVDKANLTVLDEVSLPIGKHESSCVLGARERNVHGIFLVLNSCLDQLKPALLKHVSSIGVCGQMHGCVLWDSQSSSLQRGRLIDLNQSNDISNLFTWQDERCLEDDFLLSLPKSSHNIQISSGYGCATLAWLNEFQPERLGSYNRAGTIMDLIVWDLCRQPNDSSSTQVLMSSQNATSWGYFDISEMCWEVEILGGLGLPVALLPKVAQCPARAGTLQSNWHRIPIGTPVGVAMGDLQCSVLAACPTQHDAVLNIGSASQLAIINMTGQPLPPNFTRLPTSIMEVPYFDNSTIVTAASLTGGNLVSNFVNMLSSTWSRCLQDSHSTAVIPSEQDIYKALILAAEEKMDTPLQIDVRLWGERHLPNIAGSVTNLTHHNADSGDIFSAICRGIVRNLLSMVSQGVLDHFKTKRVVGSGTALIKNSVLRKHAESVLGLPLVIKEGVDAPLGAAVAVKTL